MPDAARSADGAEITWIDRQLTFSEPSSSDRVYDDNEQREERQGVQSCRAVKDKNTEQIK
jgi:hypothetical protein